MNFPRNSLTITFILWASLLLLALPPVRSAANTLTLAWDPNIEFDLAGYKVYYSSQSGDYDSVIDVGNVTQYTIRGLEPETRYYVALTAYDASRNESDFSEEVIGISNPDPPPMQTGSEDWYAEMGCFIATAAYDSYLNPHVEILRDFRDEFLISNSLGSKSVHLYYQYGPRIANHIEKYDFLQFLTRQALLPLIGISSLSLKTTASQKLLVLILCFILIFALTIRSCLRNTLNTATRQR